MVTVLFVFGTRPEAVKLCPVIREMASQPGRFRVETCVTAQHRDLLDQVLEVFEVQPEHDLNLMEPGQTLTSVSAKILAGLEPVLAKTRPDMVVVQGDTSTTFCGALAAFHQRIPVAHVEAGLRTGDMGRPFPEELNRVLTTRIAAVHCAATDWAASNLHSEGVPEARVAVTGNPGIDAVREVARRLETAELSVPDSLHRDPSKKLILVTAHRRESFGKPMVGICDALRRIARRDDVQVVFPAHPNPSVRRTVETHLAGVPNIKVVKPLDYVDFVDLMRRSTLLLTDSGGIQEEGPSLGKPVLVMREKTERPEAVEAGCALLVGAGASRIAAAAESLLDDSQKRRAMSRVHNPFGDGEASRRIADVISSFAGQYTLPAMVRPGASREGRRTDSSWPMAIISR